MYSYDFKSNNEIIKFEKIDGIVEVDNKTYPLNIVVTNLNILLFHNANQYNVLNSRGMYMPPEYLLELKIPCQNLDYKVEDSNTLINYDKSNIVLYDLDLAKILKKEK